MLQLSQLVAAQLAHEPAVPAIVVDSPLPPLEKQANREKIRLTAWSHCGQDATAWALLMGRSSSNL